MVPEISIDGYTTYKTGKTFYDYFVTYRKQIFLSLYYSHKICVFNLNSLGLMVPEISKDGDIT